MIKANQKGYVLASVITLSAMVFIVGSSALYMTSMGGQTVSSEIQYNKAKYAAEYAFNEAILSIRSQVLANYSTNTYLLTGNGKLTNSGADYRYKTMPDNDKKLCFVYAEGSFSGVSKAVKTAVIPIKPLVGTGFQAGMVTKGLGNADLNGTNTSIGNNCGSAGVITDDNTATSVITALNGSGGAYGTPKVDNTQDVTSNKIYQATFGSTITDYTSLHNNISTQVSDKVTSLSSACSFNPVSLTGTDCTSNGSNIVCKTNGTVTKTISISGAGSCTEVAIKANVVTINGDSTVKYNVHADQDLNVTAAAKGLLASKGTLDVTVPNNTTMEGIFIGGNATAPTGGPNSGNPEFNGNPDFKGLMFYGNLTGTSNIKAVMSGNTSLLGALVVDGTLNTFRRNGGGNRGGLQYNVQYDNTIINNWGNQYPGLLNNFKCEPNLKLVNSGSYISKTKMNMY